MPVIPPGGEEWLHAFWELSTDRPVGFGFAMIPSMAISAWIENNGLRAEAEEFRACIRAMDAAYREEIEGSSGNAADLFSKLAAQE